MRKKLHLIIALLAISASTALGQITVTPDDIGDANLTGETEVTVTGEWDNTALSILKGRLAAAKNTLITFDMADATIEIVDSPATSVLSQMFKDFTQLTTVILPTASFNFGFFLVDTFNGCTNLQTVTNFDRFTYIESLDGTFQNCEALTSITLPQEVASKMPDVDIGFYNTFNGCTNLETVENLESFPNILSLLNTFRNCEALTSITLPPGTEASNVVLHGAFRGCTNLQTITNLGEFTTNIDNMDYAFQNCKALTSVTLGSVPGVGSAIDAFDGANPACVKFIGQTGFNNANYNWTCVVLPSIDNTPTTDLTTATKLVVLGAGWSDAALVTLKGKVSYSVTTLDMADATLTGDIPNGFSLQTLAGGVKSQMFKLTLTSVTFPTAGHDGEVSFNNAFNYCYNLPSIDLSGFSKISDMGGAFQKCNQLTSVIFPAVNNSASEVSFRYAFSGDYLIPKVTSIDLSGFTKISDMGGAFEKCSTLTTITLPATNTSAGEVDFGGAFSGCSALQSADISGFTKISNMSSAFASCENLTSITLPTANTSAGEVSAMHSLVVQLCSPSISARLPRSVT